MAVFDLTLTHNGVPVEGYEPIIRMIDFDDDYWVGPNGLVGQWLVGEIYRVGGDVSDKGYAFDIVGDGFQIAFHA